MSYTDIVSAVVAKLEGLSGVKRVLDYAPASVHEFPIIYVLFDSMSLTRRGPVIEKLYKLSVNLVVRYQDNERAEEEIMPYIDAIPALFLADPHLSGTLVAGEARIAEVVSGDLVRIGSADFRLIQFMLEVYSKEVA